MAKLRLVITALVTVFIAILSARSATLGVIADRLPVQALSLDQSNPVALMKLVDRDIAIAGLAQKPKKNWRSDAMTALRNRPVNPAAVRTLSLVAAGEGRKADAGVLTALAEKLSRRDGLTQLLLLQTAAERDDPRAALAHIDIALSVHSDLSTMVFPVLVQVLSDRRYAVELASLVKRDRPWLGSFLTFANASDTSPEPIADVVSLAGGLPRGENFRSHETDVLWSLANAQKLNRAAALVVELGRASSALLADGRFNEATTDAKLGPFAWTPSVDPNVSSSLDNKGTVRVLMAPGKNGIVLSRYLTLAVGAYGISAQARPDAEDMKSTLGVEVSCTSTDDQILYAVAKPVVEAGATFNGAFTVPPGCGMQRMSIAARGGDIQTDAALTISGISLTRLKQTTARQQPEAQPRTSAAQ